ncbi:hypothetical protein [Paraburkholderia strydomiana]|uniref:hypothetical protein n=1 Tax=Paraburkholderia strydomiana TaxID=1245417 RepID=UPI001BEC9D61|nr:hypothetical protein [Paraburkholderia strydomiana]MBT2791214.1 hypothetical protein [Paraburkholderia strydomiana]
MALHIIGRCGNCEAITSRTSEGSYQCRACQAKGVKPVQVQRAEKRAAKANDLPRHIEDALADARYLMRAPSSDSPRVAASIPGLGSIVLGGEGGEDIVDRIHQVWPTLNDVQVRRVVRYIDAGAAAAINATTQRPGRPKTRWVDGY